MSSAWAKGLRGKTQTTMPVFSFRQTATGAENARCAPTIQRSGRWTTVVRRCSTTARVARAENPFQQQDGLGDASFAQGDGVFAFEHGEAIGFAAQRLDSPPLAVAIGIRLDDGPGAECGALLLGQAVIVANGQRRDAGPDRAGRYS